MPFYVFMLLILTAKAIINNKQDKRLYISFFMICISIIVLYYFTVHERLII